MKKSKRKSIKYKKKSKQYGGASAGFALPTFSGLFGLSGLSEPQNYQPPGFKSGTSKFPKATATKTKAKATKTKVKATATATATKKKATKAKAKAKATKKKPLMISCPICLGGESNHCKLPVKLNCCGQYADKDCLKKLMLSSSDVGSRCPYCQNESEFQTQVKKWMTSQEKKIIEGLSVAVDPEEEPLQGMNNNSFYSSPSVRPSVRPSASARTYNSVTNERHGAMFGYRPISQQQTRDEQIIREGIQYLNEENISMLMQRPYEQRITDILRRDWINKNPHSSIPTHNNFRTQWIILKAREETKQKNIDEQRRRARGVPAGYSSWQEYYNDL